MFDALNSNRDKIKHDPKLTEQIIEKILLPQVDFITASKWVLGQYWDSASTPQKLEFIRTFRTLLLRFYSSALSEYLNTHDEKLDMSLMTFQDPAPATAVKSRFAPRSDPRPANRSLFRTRCTRPTGAGRCLM